MSKTPSGDEPRVRSDLATVARVVPYLWQDESWGRRLRILACVALLAHNGLYAALWQRQHRVAEPAAE